VENLHYFEANLSSKRCTKFHQNHLSFRYYKKRFGLFFLDTVYVPASGYTALL